MFKGLLFLGAGSVVEATHTRNMEKMGGLIRRMPVTACAFLVGAVAISGLPPLERICERVAHLPGAAGRLRHHAKPDTMMFPIAGSLLALTAALAAACFVKAFAIPFLALPRSEKPRTRGRRRSRCAPEWRCWRWDALRSGWAPHGSCRSSIPSRSRPLAFAPVRRW
jgi:hydrogenase-4 component B